VVSNDGIEHVRHTTEDIRCFLRDTLHLELSVEKTRITHVDNGFDFLGYHIQRCQPESRWVVHLRPADPAKQRIRERIKTLTASNWTWMDEYTRLTSLNALVRGWCEYYRHTSLVRDLEDVSYYAWHRYHHWLLRKHKGSRSRGLIATRTRVIHNRTRWIATITEGDHSLEAYQWLPSPTELKRSRYLQKGRNGFPHPYLQSTVEDYPQGERGPDERLFTVAIGATSRPGEPLDLHERALRAKLRTWFTCANCGRRSRLDVRHIKGQASHRLSDLRPLCHDCHNEQHGYTSGAKPQVRNRWRAGCVERRKPGSEGGMEETTMRKPGMGASVSTLRDPTPSPEDVRLTQDVAKAGDFLGVEVLDHVVIGRPGHVSLRERGWFGSTAEAAR
jgi:hypothetical protein